jgi:hypothetical protein
MRDPKDLVPGGPIDLPPVLLGCLSWIQNPPLHQCPVCSLPIEDGQPIVLAVTAQLSPCAHSAAFAA